MSVWIKKYQGILFAAIDYYCEKGRADALALVKELKEKCDHSKDNDLVMLYLDCQLLYDIYIKMDITKIEPLKEMVETCEAEQFKVIHRIRLARLYDFAGKHKESRQELKKAYASANGSAKQRIDHILKKGW